MTQSTLSIPNETFPLTRADLNTALQANGSLQSGATTPGTTYAYQFWADTTNGVLKQRDSSNASWQIRATLSIAVTPTKTASFSVALGDMGKTFLVSAASGAVTATLLAAASAGAGFYFSIKRTDNTPANAITIDANASETLDGALTQTMMNQYDLQTWECDGSNWYRIDNKPFTVTQAEITLASATTTDLGSVNSNMIAISGTTTITSFGSSADIKNPVYVLRFTGALTLTYNATSLILPSTANIVTVAGDSAIAKYEGSGNWRVLMYYRKTGQSLAGTGVVTVKRQVFNSGGTYTPSTGMLYCDAYVKGAGGGGGGVSGANMAAGGGGEGGSAGKIIDAATIGASQTVTIGTGGTAGSSSGGTGGTGGTTSLGAIISATGGVGGTGATSGDSPVAGGVGGVGSSGDYNLTGTSGGVGGLGITASDSIAGYGGAGMLSGGTSFGTTGTGGSTAGTANSGAGGTGAATAGGGGGTAGGVGGSGKIIITEYCSQ